ncbi:MAG TPA: hypothetical protein VG737_04360, partial [Cyclobacteriaceae bacterium]|nr:hypothetical protein [Cyclobacteriaceae bacterium]
MKNLFVAADTREILERVEKITPQSPRQWGKMDAAQMLAHCSKCMEMANGTLQPKRTLIGKIMGGFFKSQYTNEKPFSPGSPTSAETEVRGTYDFDVEKQKLVGLIRQFSESKTATTHPHPFFGSF